MLVLVNEFDAGLDIHGNPQTLIRVEFIDTSGDEPRYTNILWFDSSYLGNPPTRSGMFGPFDVEVNDDDVVRYIGSFDVTQKQYDEIVENNIDYA